MKKNDKFILTPELYNQEEWCDFCKEIIKEYQKLNNITKEVREYIEEKEKDDDNWVDYELLIEPIRIKEILGIEIKT